LYKTNNSSKQFNYKNHTGAFLVCIFVAGLWVLAGTTLFDSVTKKNSF